MFCMNCGTKNEDSAKFCQKCGKRLLPEKETSSSEQISHTPQTQPHPYHELGGWLAVIAYGQLIGLAVIVFGAVAGGLALIRYASYLGGGLVLLGLFCMVVYIPAVYFAIQMYQMIKSKDPRFLRFYEQTMLALIAVHAVLILLGSVIIYLPSTGSYVKSLLEQVIIFAIWMTYFSKSVRVRTYFGTDEYLKQSIFLKNCQAPDPLD